MPTVNLGFELINDHYTHSLYLAGAKALGYEVETLDHEFAFSKVTTPKQKYSLFSAMLSVNNSPGNKFANNKYLVSKVFREAFGLAPESKLFYLEAQRRSNYDEIVEFTRSKNFQVVIKPLSLSGGKGITILPRDETEVREALRLIEGYKEKMITIEDFVNFTDEYRILSYKGKVIDLLKRIPAQIIGDGVLTVKGLIEQKNDYRSNYSFKPIEVDIAVDRMLAEQSLSFDSVPAKDQIVRLKQACNFGQGGEVIRVSKAELHEGYQAVINQVHEISGLNLVGIDLMTNDIKAKPARSVAVINEINSSPSIEIHQFADLKENNSLNTVKNLWQEILAE